MLLLLACATPTDSGAAPEPVDFLDPGPYGAGHRAVVLDADPTRPVPADLWYPTTAASTEVPMATLLTEAEASVYAPLLAAAPEACPTRTLDLAADAPVAGGGPWPLVAMSHCADCTRFSNASVAARLAGRGFVVLSVDHPGDTLFDDLAGAGLPLDTDTLALRTADLSAGVDAALDGTLGVDVDPTRVGVYGHSFGAVTAGMVLQSRLNEVHAGFFVGAPPENPLLPGVDAAALDAPVAFYRLLEDHSVGAAGNLLIDANYAEVPGPAWEIDLADGGHWSPSDLVGVVEDFEPGCGDDTRESGGAAFTYPDPARARAVTGAAAAAFFSTTLLDDPAGAVWLASPPPELAVSSR